MMTIKKFLIPAVLAITAIPAAADDAEALAKLKQLLQGLDTLQAEFTQTVLNDDLETVRQSIGTFYLQRANGAGGGVGKFRWDYVEPFEQLIIGDGVNLWTYDPDLEQATVKPMQETLASSPASLLTGTSPVEEEFDVSEIGRSGELYWIGLKPRVQDTDFERVRVGLNNGELDTMELLDNLGQTTRIRFHDVSRNVDIPAERFTFSPPQGADLIGESTSR